MSYKIIISIFLLSMLALSAFCQEQRLDQSSLLFGSDDILNIEIETDLEALLGDVGEERSQHPSKISIVGAGIPDSSASVPVKIKTRGKFRRNPDNCNFPPLRLNFAKKSNTTTAYAGLDKVKLVTHCQDSRLEYEQYVVQEYLLYRVYNQLSEASFKVRLAKITYKDTQGRRQPAEHFGFFIEDEKVMASRQQATLFEPEDLKNPEISYDQSTLIHLFAFMAGNVDWSVPIQHNVKLVGTSPTETLMPIPYDFDHAAVIDTEYADDPPLIGTASIRYQLFRTFCRSEKELQPFFQRFQDKKSTIYELYEEMELLTDESRNQALKYYNRFYRIISDESAIERTFVKPCS